MKWFDPKITLGTVVTVVAFGVSGVYFQGKQAVTLQQVVEVVKRHDENIRQIQLDNATLAGAVDSLERQIARIQDGME